MCAKNFRRFQGSTLIPPMGIIFLSTPPIRGPQDKRSWIMFLRKRGSFLNILLLFEGGRDSSESAWALMKKTPYASMPLKNFWRTGKRRRRHEEESFRKVDGDSPRIGDLVGFLTLNLFRLGRGHA